MLVAYYNPDQGNLTATLSCEPNAIPEGVPYVELPPDFDLADLASWKVDLATKQLIRVGRPVETHEVNAERDRRIRAGFSFMGHTFDFDEESEKNITGAGSSAGLYIAMGKDPSSLRWANLNADFVFINAANAAIPMTAQQCFEFSQAAMQHKSAHIFKARALKDQTPIPEDYKDNKYWPSQA